MRALIAKYLALAHHKFLKTFVGIRATASIHLNDNEQLFSYTSGRWLWNENSQLNARYRRLNLSCLKQLASELTGSTECILLEKIGEGSYNNKAFQFVISNCKRLIAKILSLNSGSAMYKTASEVATMDFGRTVLELPISKALSWSATNNNPIDSEYIIMEEANGLQLNDVWSGIAPRV